MVTTKLNLSMTEPSVRQIYAKQGDTGRVLDISLDQTPEDGTLRILRPDGTEVTSEAVTGGEVSESGETVTFESMTEADVTELTVGIEPVQDLSNGDPSPTNICPITGHDEVTVNFGAEQGTADNTYTTSLGQTVYGGTLDLVSGVLTMDKAMVDLGSLSWSMSGSGNTVFFYANTASLGVASDITTSLNYICENYSIVAVSSGGTATGMAFTSASQLRIRDATYSDATSFKTAMNGVQLVYQLATPVEYQLTPQQVKTLVGTNNVWASSGDIVSIKFAYGGLFSELPSEATEIVGKCYCDIEQNGVSSMPFTLNVKKNERES